jgi:hypothetical protein
MRTSKLPKGRGPAIAPRSKKPTETATATSTPSETFEQKRERVRREYQEVRFQDIQISQLKMEKEERTQREHREEIRSLRKSLRRNFQHNLLIALKGLWFAQKYVPFETFNPQLPTLAIIENPVAHCLFSLTHSVGNQCLRLGVPADAREKALLNAQRGILLRQRKLAMELFWENVCSTTNLEENAQTDLVRHVHVVDGWRVQAATDTRKNSEDMPHPMFSGFEERGGKTAADAWSERFLFDGVTT